MSSSFFLMVSLLLISCPALSQISLKHENSSVFKGTVISDAEHYGLINVEVDNDQSFTIVSDGKVLGAIIQGKGWLRETQPVCFIGWSGENKKIDKFIPTIGQGDWETVGCHKIESVGLISKKDDENARVAIIYTVELSRRFGTDYYILSINKFNGRLQYDEETTKSFQNSYLRNIQALRKAYQN
jgi:hypothetical protein